MNRPPNSWHPPAHRARCPRARRHAAAQLPTRAPRDQARRPEQVRATAVPTRAAGGAETPARGCAAARTLPRAAAHHDRGVGGRAAGRALLAGGGAS